MTSRVRGRTAGLVLLLLTVQGCGLVYDAVQHVRAIRPTDEVTTICDRHQLRVGITREPFVPFLFPEETQKNERASGLDIDLVRELTDTLTAECAGNRVAPVLQHVGLRDMFTALNERQIDLFVSALGANVPAPHLSGVAYSLPYFYDGGIVGMSKKPEVIARVQSFLRSHGQGLHGRDQALSGLTIAVQDGTSAHGFSMMNLKESKVIVVDSLLSTLERGDPSIDVILGSYPVLKYMTEHVRKDWHLITADTERPVFLTRENYAIVMPEANYRLRWLVNRMILQLEETGRLKDMQRRWFEQDKAHADRGRDRSPLLVTERNDKTGRL